MSRLVRTGVVLLAPVLALAACTSGRNVPEAGGTTSSSPLPSTPVATSSAPSTTAVTSPSTSAAAATTSPPASSSSAPARPAEPAFTTTCRSLSVRVFKGGGIRGMEIAALQFVNDGATSCTMTGTPSARLVRNGSVVGSASRPNGTDARPFTVEPGDYAESLLRVNSTCNAPLSDNVRFRLPSRGGAAGRTVTEPIELRACRVTVAPVGAPS